MPPTPFPPLPLSRRLAALGGAALLAVPVLAACQTDPGARAEDHSTDLSEATDRLLAWDAVTVQAGIDATPEEVYDYMLRAGGGEQPSMDDARRLADLEVTTSYGDPAGEDAELRETAHGTELYGGVAIGFGGEDALGVKSIGNETFAKVNWESLVRDVYAGDEAEVADAHRFQEDAYRLPGSLYIPALALSGGWVRAEPERYGEYAQVVSERTDVPRDSADTIAGLLTDAGSVLTVESQWRLLDTLKALGGAPLRETAGTERGATMLQARLPAGEAWRALEPLATLLNDQATRFGLPPLVAEPTADTPVTLGLLVRNGVLTGLTVDLAQLSPADPGSATRLPLTLTLTGGSALSLSPPSDPTLLTPEDLDIALMYLNEREQERTSDPDRADVPGPVQP